MNTSKFSDWLHIVATIGVLLGIIFVAEELRQNNELARAQSVRDLYFEWQDIYRFSYDNNVDSLIYKSVEQSEELSDAEIRKLSSYFDMIMGAQLAQASMQLRFGLAYDVMTEAPAIAEEFFSSPFGKAWFYENIEYVGYEGDEFLEAMKDAVDNTELQMEDESLKRLKSRL